MCGFAGFVRPPGPQAWDPAASLRAMVGSLLHRGPDDEGVWSDPPSGVYLGFRRLAILDLSQAGHQPMVSSTGRFVIVFNGEVYNFQELRAELSAAGFTFRGGSDTEVLLAAFERWGVRQAVPRFRGMFAFALWDSVERRLSLVRDRMGIKPLYLLANRGGIAFASEARAFRHCPFFSGSGNADVARDFLRRLYVPGRRSILNGVERVAPGEIVEFTVGSDGPRESSRHPYWDLSTVRETGQKQPITDEREVLEGLDALLRESVRLRMIADVPVGALLSGGVDSSLVVALMKDVASAPVRTFTISFDDPDFDEGPVAEAVASHLGTCHTSITLPTRDALDLVPGLAELSDEPMANPSLLPTLLVSRVARRDVVVALSGDGGDELFGGYNRYLHGARWIRGAERLPAFARPALGKVLSAVAGTGLASAAFGVLRPSSAGKQQSPAERLNKLAGLLGAGTRRAAYEALLDVGWARPPLLGRPSADQAGHYGAEFGRDLEADMMLMDQGDYLPDDLLAKVDRASMRESLEARVPILDHKVVEFSWRVPTDLKIRNGVSKWPLRALARRYLPESILDRPKMGFTVPIARWLSVDLRDWARDTLSLANPTLLPIWDKSQLDDAWTAFEAGRTDMALPLWAATNLQAWSDAAGVRFDEDSHMSASGE